DDRAAERKLLPLAAERGIAILVNVPFGGGGLLRRLRDRPLPDWAAEIGCTSWAQILLKFVLAHPSVTCVIPGTGNPAHMRTTVEPEAECCRTSPCESASLRIGKPATNPDRRLSAMRDCCRSDSRSISKGGRAVIG